jgi:hypothetical protein
LLLVVCAELCRGDHLANLKIFHAGSMRKVGHGDGAVFTGGQEGGVQGEVADIAAGNFQAGKLRKVLFFPAGSLLKLPYLDYWDETIYYLEKYGYRRSNGWASWSKAPVS